MKFSVVALAVALLFIGCTAPQKVQRAPAAAAEDPAVAKVLAFFNKGIDRDGGRQAANLVSFENGKFVAVDAESKHVEGHFMEDCRKVAVRQAILDTTQTGAMFKEVSRKGSHRLAIFESRPGVLGDVGAMVGVRSQMGGAMKEQTYFYDLKDDSSGDCEVLGLISTQDGMQDRRKVEAFVLNEVWPKVDEVRKTQMRNWYKARYNATDDTTVVANTVGKLVEWECEQFAINAAAQRAQDYFVQQFHTQPILLLDFEYSRIVSNIDEDSRGPHKIGESRRLKELKGYLVYRMSDRTGDSTAMVKVPLTLTEKKDKCEGSVAAKAEAFTLP